ncbi:DUF4245 domain-containing protein [Microbacterium sp. LWO14-1.2]|uniref:DUF4245 family protein n=1 Tax=Microbacterium sp. LWO14-1.2 TaxID=3135263 RepID=UPI003138FF8D
MSRRAPIVAELGRPETPEETAVRKAEFSKAYRSSQTVRGLIAALLATLAIVVVIVLAVPRGEPATERTVDMVGIAADVESSVGSPVIVPELGDFWRVNAAGLTSGATPVWDVTLAPASQNERGFIKLAQAFGVDSSWAPQRLNGIAPTDATDIGGLEWDVYSLGDAGAKQNVTYAIGTQAGDDYVLLYGSRSAESTADLAETLVPQIRDLSE